MRAVDRRFIRGSFAERPDLDPTVFTKNRDRLQKGEVFAKLMGAL
jgi:hypothetical protein